MKTAAILIIVLLTIAQASQTKTKTGTGATSFLGVTMNFSSRRSFLSVLTQVEAKLKNGGTLDTINQLLDDFKEAVIEEQVAHDVLHDKQQATCAEELEFRETEVSDATGAFKASQETYQGCVSQQLRAKADAAIIHKQLQESRSFFVTIEDNRRREQQFYQYHVDQLQDIQQTAEEVLVKIEELLSGEGDFIQIVKSTNKMIKTAVHAQQFIQMQGMLQALLTISSKSADELDEVLLNWCKTQIQNYLDNIQDYYQEVVEAEDTAAAAYAEEHQRLADIQQNLEDTEQQLNDDIAALDKCIITQSGIVNSSRAKLERNQLLGDDAEDLCTVADEEYVQASAARKGELKLLEAVRERADFRFGQLSDSANNLD